MAHVVADMDSSASADQVIHALTDFSPRRFELWPNIDRKFYKLESTDASSAEVTEGTGGFNVWEKAHYDWSQPGQVRIDVEDSNTFEAGSYWLYEVTPKAGGGSHVHMEFDRRPKNLKGQFMSALFTVAGNSIFKKYLGETLKRIESTPE